MFYLEERAKTVGDQAQLNIEKWKNFLANTPKNVNNEAPQKPTTAGKALEAKEAYDSTKRTFANDVVRLKSATKDTWGWLRSFLPGTDNYEIRKKTNASLSVMENCVKRLNKYSIAESPEKYDIYRKDIKKQYRQKALASREEFVESKRKFFF